MADVPVRCRNCDAVYPSGFGSIGAGQIVLEDCESQCPNCGHLNKVSDGTYEISGNVLSVLDAPRATIFELLAIQNVLQAALEQRLSRAEIVQRLDKAVAVERRGKLAALLPQDRKDVHNYILIILGLLTLLVTYYGVFHSAPSLDADDFIQHLRQMELSDREKDTPELKQPVPDKKVRRAPKPVERPKRKRKPPKDQAI